MRHRRPDQRGRVKIALVQPANEFRGQPGHVLGVRGRVGDTAGNIRRGHVDRSGPPPSRSLDDVMALHHEVQRVEQFLAVGEVVPGRPQALHVGHRLAVALDLDGHRLARLDRRLPGDHVLDVLDARRIALNGVGPGDGPCGEVPPELPLPPGRSTQVQPETIAHGVNLREYLAVRLRQFRHLIQHDTMIPSWCHEFIRVVSSDHRR